MKFQHVIDAVYHRPWLITSGGHASVRRLLEAKMQPKSEDGAEIMILMENPRRPAQIDTNGIGHIHICGVIGHRLGTMEKSCGNTCVCEVRKELDALIADGAKGIFLDIDSPGGTVTGVPELGAALAQASLELPMVAYSDSLIASAAYWLACAAGKIWASPSAEVGSIGVLFPWIDSSAAWQQMGVQFEPITNTEGIFKSAGHGPALTDEQKEEIQASVQRVYNLFSAFVAEQRALSGGFIYPEAMQGQTMLAMDGMAYGVVDAVGTKEQAYTALCNAADVFPMDVPIDCCAPISFSQSNTQIADKNKDH